MMTAAFTGSTAGAQTGGFFANGTFITQLNNNVPGSMLNSLWGTFSLACNFAGANAWQGNLPASPCPAGTPAVGAFPINQFVVSPHSRGNSFLFGNDGHSTYHSLQLEVRRRLAKGVQLNANYSWSKALSNLFADSSVSFAGFSTMRNHGRDKGVSPWDLRHQFKAHGIWELPFGPGRKWSSSHGWVNRLIEGWEVSSIVRWQSGRAFLITSGLGGTFNQNDGGVTLTGISASQIQESLEIRKLQNGTVFWIPAALIDSAGRANSSFIRSCGQNTPSEAGTFCGRPFLYGPQFFRQDWNIVKRTRITERVNWELRFEFLNAYNNVNFFYPGSETTSVASVSAQTTAFGRVTNAYRDFSTTDDPGGRIIQLVMRINF
jgi:hypothetical protein